MPRSVSAFTRRLVCLSFVAGTGLTFSHGREGLLVEDVLLAGVDDAGLTFVAEAPESGRGNIKGTINTHKGEFRATIKGEGVNAAQETSTFENDPTVNEVLETVLGEDFTVQQSKYKVTKKGKIRGKCFGEKDSGHDHGV